MGGVIRDKLIFLIKRQINHLRIWGWDCFVTLLRGLKNMILFSV